jgi:hypothetical protein
VDLATHKDTLTAIGQRHGTDKASRHSYTDFYERLIGHLRDRPIRLLEFGIGGYEDPSAGGNSLRMWREYFPNAEVIGVDVYDKSGITEDRIAIVQGDQSDRLFLRQLGEDFGPFDVVIDDGSHLPAHVLTTFQAIFPYVLDGGYYFVEDTQTSYWPSFGGSLLPHSNRSTMGFFKRRVDGLNFAEFRIPGYHPTEYDLQIDEINFRRNLVAVRKGANAGDDANPIRHPIPYSAFLRTSGPQFLKRLMDRGMKQVRRMRTAGPPRTG